MSIEPLFPNSLDETLVFDALRFHAGNTMSITYIDGLPGFEDADCRVRVQVNGAALFVKSPLCLARIELSTGNVDWLVDRSLSDEPKRRVRERVLVWGKDLWISDDGTLVAELLPSQDGGLLVSVRDAQTSKSVWEKSIPVDVACDAFFAADDKRLVVCLFRESRRVAVADGKDKLPPCKCHADVTRFEPQTGQLMWSGSFPGLHVSMIERETFRGLWTNQNKLGRLDLETGSNAIIHEFPYELGRVVSIGTGLAVSWHNTREVGVSWLDEHGAQTDSCVIPEARVHSTRLHNTGAGLGLQLNDAEKVWWLGEHRQPLWNVKAKPYVYRVWRQAGGDLFVATDGNGGRVFGFDADSGHETLNLKPALYGVGSLTRVGESSTLVASFRASKSQSKPPSLLILSMTDRSHRFAYECQLLEGTWQHGAICRTGDRCERLAIIDLREKPERKVTSTTSAGDTRQIRRGV